MTITKQELNQRLGEAIKVKSEGFTENDKNNLIQKILIFCDNFYALYKSSQALANNDAQIDANAPIKKLAIKIRKQINNLCLLSDNSLEVKNLNIRCHADISVYMQYLDEVCNLPKSKSYKAEIIANTIAQLYFDNLKITPKAKNNKNIEDVSLPYEKIAKAVSDYLNAGITLPHMEKACKALESNVKE